MGRLLFLKVDVLNRIKNVSRWKWTHERCYQTPFFALSCSLSLQTWWDVTHSDRMITSKLKAFLSTSRDSDLLKIIPRSLWTSHSRLIIRRRSSRRVVSSVWGNIGTFCFNGNTTELLLPMMHYSARQPLSQTETKWSQMEKFKDSLRQFCMFYLVNCIFYIKYMNTCACDTEHVFGGFFMQHWIMRLVMNFPLQT